jgi:L-2,4-diaminobutyrate transaminase
MSRQTTSGPPLEALDRQSVFHPATSIADHLQQGPRIIVEGSGVTLIDSTGKRYLDAVAGLWCVNIGYGRPEVADAMASMARRLGYYHTFSSFSNEPQIRLADRLLALMPGRMSKVFFGNSGSDANDTQIKLVWYYNNLRGKTRKKKIIGRIHGYHGSTVATASLSGLPAFHRHFDLPIPNVLHADAPHYYRHGAPGQSEEQYATALAQALEDLIQREGPDTVGAFIAEPIMGGGGVLVPPRTYFEKVQAVLRKHDVLMIVDEVICGFGRLGRMFGSDVYGIEPDLMTCAKGLTSAYFPLSAVVISEKVWTVLRDGSPEVGAFAHGYTYSGHPVGAAAAMANLDILLGEDMVGNAARTGAYLQARLRDTVGALPLVGDVRGVGLAAGVEVVADRVSRGSFDPGTQVAQRVAARCLEDGLIVRALPVGNVIALSPPLCITRAEVDQAVTVLARAIRTVSDELLREGLWQAP